MVGEGRVSRDGKEEKGKENGERSCVDGSAHADVGKVNDLKESIQLKKEDAQDRTACCNGIRESSCYIYMVLNRSHF